MATNVDKIKQFCEKVKDEKFNSVVTQSGFTNNRSSGGLAFPLTASTGEARIFLIKLY